MVCRSDWTLYSVEWADDRLCTRWSFQGGNAHSLAGTIPQQSLRHPLHKTFSRYARVLFIFYCLETFHCISQSEGSWHFQSLHSPCQKSNINKNLFLIKCYSPIHALETPLWGTNTTETQLGKATSPLPVEWAMVWQMSVLFINFHRTYGR